MKSARASASSHRKPIEEACNNLPSDLVSSTGCAHGRSQLTCTCGKTCPAQLHWLPPSVRNLQFSMDIRSPQALPRRAVGSSLLADWPMWAAMGASFGGSPNGRRMHTPDLMREAALALTTCGWRGGRDPFGTLGMTRHTHPSSSGPVHRGDSSGQMSIAAGPPALPP